jgi:hypothetical protein
VRHIAHGDSLHLSWETPQNIWRAPILHQQSHFHFPNGVMPSTWHKQQPQVRQDHQYLAVNLENVSSSMLAGDNLVSMALKAS